MALYRTICLTFWTDTKIQDEFTPEDRYFYLYLFTNPHTNLAGCYEVSVRQMANETGYNRDSIERLLKRFSETHKVAYYSEGTKEVLLPNWHKYNWTSSEKFRKPLGQEIERIKNPDFRIYLQGIFNGEENIRYPIDTNCIDTSVTVTDKYNKELLETKIIDSDTKSLTETEGINSIVKDIQEIIDYLNLKTGKHYTTKNKANVRKIQARFKEGYKVEDFKKIIDTKYDSWKGTKYQMFLRPETLFSAEHFESYLNESVEPEQPKYENKPEEKVRERTEEEWAVLRREHPSLFDENGQLIKWEDDDEDDV